MPLALVLPLPAEVAARVALPASVPGALPASDLHVTLAALTSAPPDLLGSLAALAAHAAPLAATLSGTGRFASPVAEGDAFYLSVDAPASSPSTGASSTASTARRRTSPSRTSRPTTLRPPIERFGPEPVRFEALALWDGDTRTAFPFGTAIDTTTTLDAVALPDTPPAELRGFAAPVIPPTSIARRLRPGAPRGRGCRRRAFATPITVCSAPNSRVVRQTMHKAQTSATGMRPDSDPRQ
ncbi:MAG: hypothetical protein JNK72_01165 [Myxococcales bacterium]|nr:hypothetical protein [Myxococcales bacterium]